MTIAHLLIRFPSTPAFVCLTFPSTAPSPLRPETTGSNFPTHVFPSIVGRPILRVEERDQLDVPIKDIMVGDEAAAVRNYLQVTQPMEHGVVKDFGDMRHGELAPPSRFNGTLVDE